MISQPHSERNDKALLDRFGWIPWAWSLCNALALAWVLAVLGVGFHAGGLIILWFGGLLGILVAKRILARFDAGGLAGKRTLHRLNTRYEAILQALPDIVVEVDNDKRYTWANRAGFAFFGEDMLGREAGDFFVGEQTTYEQVRPVFEGSGEVIILNSWQRRRDGAHRLLNWHCRALQDPEGRVTGALSIARDVTEQEQASRERGMLSHALRSINESVCVTDMENRLLFVNEAFLKTYGYEEHELIGQPIDIVRSQREQSVVTGGILPGTLSGRWQGVLFNRRKDSSEFPIRLSSTTIRDDRDRPLALVGVATDISGEMESHEALRSSEERLAGIIEGIPLGIITLDGTGVVTTVNSAARGMLDLPVDTEDRKQNVLSLEQISGTEFGPRLRALIESGRRYELETDSLSDSRARPRWLHCLGLPIVVSQSAGLSYLLLFGDISERKSNENERLNLESQLRQAQKMQAIGTLAGGIAHDFNNILLAIHGYADLAKASLPEDSHSQEHLNQVLVAANRAADLVRQILTFSRQTEHERRPLLLQPLVKETLKLIRRSLPSTIKVATEFEPRSIPVLADSSQVHQVIMNLCTNAYQAMRDSGGTLSVRLKAVELDEGEVARHPGLRPRSYSRLTISHTGCGMSREIRERIFEPYFTTKKIGEGTGLGLAMVLGIVEAHEGAITVESRPGEGSTFTVYLPHCSQPEELLKDETAGGETVTGQERILFVDDDEPIVELSLTSLRSFGYEVTGRTSSVEALEVFRSNPETCDLLITDLTMPNMDGLELARRVLEIRPQLPIILLTGFSEEITERDARSIGIRAFLHKPVSYRDLAGAIRETLSDGRRVNAGGGT